MKLKVCILLCSILLFTKALGCERTLKVGISQQWAPYVLIRDKTFSGIDIQITEFVLSQSGFCTQFVLLPSSKRGFAELRSGKVDLLPAASFSEERARFSYFSEPYRKEVMRLFWYPKKEYAALSLKGLLLKGQVILINSGSYYGEEFTTLSRIKMFKNQIMAVPKLQQRLGMLLAKRVDFFIDDELAGLYLIESLNLKGIELHDYIINDNWVSFMLSKTTLTESERTRINNTIIAHQQTITGLIAEHIKSFSQDE